MNTKTLRRPSRRMWWASGTGNGSGSSNKRKEREDGFERPKPSITTAKLLEPDKPKAGSKLSNQLLAGYLAHEYLTRGTLFGQPWDQARVEGSTVVEKKKGKLSLGEGEGEGEGEEGEGEGEAAVTPSRRAELQQPEEKYKRYLQVSGLLKEDGAHLVGLVNPTQLACFLQF